MPDQQWIEIMKNIAKRKFFGFVSFGVGSSLNSLICKCGSSRKPFFNL